jgi:hypothetical protein
MTTQVLKNASVTLDSVDLSSYCEKIALTYKSDMNDVSAMGDTAHAKLGGLVDWSISADFFEDNSSSGPSATLFGQVGASIAVAILPNGGTVGSTNPKYSGNAIVESITPVDGSVGTAQKVTVSLQGTGTLTRATS